MSANLTIRDVPDDLAARLKARARRNHRSVQGELISILEETLLTPELQSPADLLAAVSNLGLQTPAESARIIREERDAH